MSSLLLKKHPGMRMRELTHTRHWMRSKFSKVIKCLSPQKKFLFLFLLLFIQDMR